MKGIKAISLEEWQGGEDELPELAGPAHKAICEAGAGVDFQSIRIGTFAGAHFAARNEEFGARAEYHRVQRP